MATLTNPNYGLAPSFGHAGDIKVVDSGDIAVATADIAANGLIKLFRARKGFVVTGAFMKATDLDTNGTPTITMVLGDLTDDDRFVASSTIGQAGGQTMTLAAAGTLYKFTADTDVYIKFPAGAATAAAGTVSAGLIGYNTEF